MRVLSKIKHRTTTGSSNSTSGCTQKVKSLSQVRLFAAPWTVVHQAPPSMEFSRQESWSGVSFPSPGDLPNPGMEPGSPTLQADTLPSEPPGKKRGLEQMLYTHVHGRFFPSTQKEGIIQMSIDRYVGKQDVIYSYNGLLFGLKKERNLATQHG